MLGEMLTCRKRGLEDGQRGGVGWVSGWMDIWTMESD